MNWLFGYPDGDWVMQYMNFVSHWGLVIEMLQRPNLQKRPGA